MMRLEGRESSPLGRRVLKALRSVHQDDEILYSQKNMVDAVARIDALLPMRGVAR